MVEKFTSYREDIVTEIGNNGFSLIKKIISHIICIAKRNFFNRGPICLVPISIKA